MTIKDIAKHFNISPSMVSRALSGAGYVKADKRQAIIAYAREHHFQISSTASALKKGSKDIVGILTPWTTFNQIDFLSQLMNMLARNGKTYRVEFGCGAENVERLIAAPVEQILAVNIHQNQYQAVLQAQKNGIKVLNIMGYCENVPAIRPFHGRAFLKCFEMLYNAGHRHIGYAGIDFNWQSDEIQFDYQWQVKKIVDEIAGKYNIYFAPEDQFFFQQDGYKCDEEKLIEFLKKRRHTAMIVWTEQMQTAVYAACRKIGLKIPHELSLAGIGGNFMLNGFDPPLTHYRFDYDELLKRTEFFVNNPEEIPFYQEVDFKYYPGESIEQLK